jgi:hypothetical protein
MAEATIKIMTAEKAKMGSHGTKPLIHDIYLDTVQSGRQGGVKCKNVKGVPLFAHQRIASVLQRVLLGWISQSCLGNTLPNW